MKEAAATIERSEAIRFHEKGTLEAVTRWIATHHDGIAEWMKNVRRQYQVDRADVALDHRVAVLLLKDGEFFGTPARIGLLDVGGATLEDVTAWSTWQDPDASRRGSSLAEEETQGNGGKAYMYRLFKGPARILGVREGRRNCKGFEGVSGTVERGTPGWIPNLPAGRDVEISSLDAELGGALSNYDAAIDDLPKPVRTAIQARKAFTLVEGEGPEQLYKSRIDADDFIGKITRHDQATLCLEQVDFYVVHNGRLANDGKPLRLPSISPYPGLDSPIVSAIPEQLPLEGGQTVSTTEGGTKQHGRLVLHTSAENMPAAYKNLRPRWQIIYRTAHQMVGAKPMSEIAGTTAGAQYVYGTVELPALEPAYVEHGRRRPKPGPLTEALDLFIAEKIKEVAQKINARRQEKLDEHGLDEVHDENRKLNEFKNRFLPNYGEGSGGRGTGGEGPGGGGGGTVEWGSIPDDLLYSVADGGIQIGKQLSLALRSYLDVSIRDANGRPVQASLEWITTDRRVASISASGMLEAKAKGECEISVRVEGTQIESRRIPVRVWNVDHVLITPRALDIPLGTRQQIVAEVTDDEGRRSTDVLLEWRHDADDQFVVRISQSGMVTGNRLGRTAISAGAAGVWARIPAEVNVIPNPSKPKRGSGFPRLLLTGRDLDPATGVLREGDPDQPPLWQEPSDFIHNVWWLNLQSPEAAYAFKQRGVNPSIWRAYHAERVIDMVVQVWMTEEFTRKGEQESPDYWVAHRAAMERHRIRMAQQMWKRLEPYVSGGGSLPIGEEDRNSA